MSASRLRAALRWAVALGYFVAVALGHLAFSFWLVRERQGPWGPYAFKQAMPALVALGFAALALWAWCGWRRASPRTRVALPGFLLLWYGAVYAIDATLTFTLNEYAHYPQYAILGWLVAWAMDPARQRWVPARALFWTTLAGAVDEAQQYLWIAPSYGHYFDTNDVVVNLVAGALGIVVFYGWRDPPAARPAAARRGPVAEYATAALLALALAAGLASGRLLPAPPPGVASVPPGGMLVLEGRRVHVLQREPGWWGAWHPADRHPSYWVLTPAAMAGLLACGLAALWRYPLRGWRPRGRQPPRPALD